MSKIRVLWASKHQIGMSQHKSLETLLGAEFELEGRVLQWASSIDEEADNGINIEMWEDISRDFDVVVGVFPPTAIIALLMARGIADEEGNEEVDRLKVFTPIATINYFSHVKNFTFLRWQEI